MNEFSELIADGFAEFLEHVGVPLMLNGQTAQVIPGNSAAQRELRETGYWETGMQTVEITRADLERLGITDRSKPEMDGKTWKVSIIDKDPADPCVRLTLKPDHAR